MAWRGWYHVTGTTYGNWLPGDPRGWRARHHRDHVEGDYKHPPDTDEHASLHIYARDALKRPPLRLTVTQRGVAGKALVERLTALGVEVLVVALDAVHYHVLGRFSEGQVRRLMGLAKKHASHVLREHGLPGTVWAKRNRPHPITDRAHQLNVFRYIVDHKRRGAWVWTFRDAARPAP